MSSIIPDSAVGVGVGGGGWGGGGKSLSMVLKDRRQKIGNFWIDLSIKAGEEAKSMVPEATPSPPTASLSGRYEGKDGWMYTTDTHIPTCAQTYICTKIQMHHPHRHAFIHAETHTIHMHALL